MLFLFLIQPNSMTILSKPQPFCFDRFVPATLGAGAYEISCTDGETPIKSAIEFVVKEAIKPVIKKALPATFTKGQVKFEVQV